MTLALLQRVSGVTAAVVMLAGCGAAVRSLAARRSRQAPSRALARICLDTTRVLL